MKKLLILAVLAGCGPIAADATIGWGANQRIKKTLDINQKQTAEQTESQAVAVEDIIKILPLLRTQPTPIPPPSLPLVNHYTIEMPPPEYCVPSPTPRPHKKTVRKTRTLPPCAP